jgi:PAS domain S-box-containing protein
MPAPAAPPLPLPPGVDEETIFRTLFLAYPDALLVVDAAGIVVMCNPSAAQLLGYGVEELVGSNVDLLVPDAVRPRHASFRQGYAQAPRARPMGTQMDLVARRKDGSEVMVEIALSPLHEHGLPFVAAAIRGIGIYPRVQQALQRARYSEYLADFGRLVVDARDPHTLLDRVPAIAAEALGIEVAMVFLLDKDGRSLRVAGGVGMVAGEEIGSLLPYRPLSTPGVVLSQERPLRVEDYRTEQRFEVPQAYLDAGLTSALAVPVSDRGHTIGALSVRTRAQRHFDDDDLRFLLALANLLAASLQRAEYEDTLSHTERLESVGQLTGGIAHDFNNLLTVIQGNLQVLEDQKPIADDPTSRQLMAAAMRATRRGAELTGKLLAFSRRQVLQPSPVDVAGLLQALAGMLRRTLDQHIRIEVDAPPECPAVLADPVQLESALLNIAINARDAMPGGGSLQFRARSCAALPASIAREPEWAPPQGRGYVAISVTDSGMGMSDAVRERALEPFFTTKEPGRGTGLGLSTVYGFAMQSRGALTIDSSPGAGTTITLYIPQSSQVEPAAAAEAQGTDEIPAGLGVLLVEDDAEVRGTIASFLRGFGCQLSMAASGEQALALLETAHPRFDLLLTDIALGAGMRGTELAARMHRQSPGLAILLMSGFSSELLEADRAAPPAWELLPKPCTRQELARAILKALAARPASA